MSWATGLSRARQHWLCKGTVWVCGGVEEIDVRFQKRFVTALQSLDQKNIAIHPRCPRISLWWDDGCSADEGPRVCLGNGRFVDGCSDGFGFGVCELVARDSIGALYPQEGCRTLATVEL